MINHGLSFQLNEELKQLDMQYNGYIQDLQERGDDPKVIRGMIRIYEQKIKMLENTLREIEKNERHENHKKSI